MSPKRQVGAFLVIDGPGHEGTRVPLEEGITALGRLPANDVILLHEDVSRHHARIAFFEGRATLQDLGSHNGCFVNGDRVDTRLLEDGDRIRVGAFTVRYRRAAPDDGPAEPLAAAVDTMVEAIEAARRGEPSPPRALHFLYRATAALARAPDALAFGEEMLELALEHTGSRGAAWVDGAAEAPVLRARSVVDGFELALPRRAIRWALERRCPVRAGEDPASDPTEAAPGVERRGPPSLVMPLAGPSQEVLVVQRSRGPFGPDELARLGAVAHLTTEGLAELGRRETRRVLGLGGSEIRPRIEATVALLDLRGLGGPADRVDHPDLPRLLRLVPATLAEPLGRVGAWLEPMNGARFLAALRGVDRSPPEAVATLLDALQRVSAAWEDEVDALRRAGPRLRIGVASGPAVTGHAGGRAFVWGAAAQRAAQLAEGAPDGRVLVDASTLRRARPTPRTERVPSLDGSVRALSRPRRAKQRPSTAG